MELEPIKKQVTVASLVREMWTKQTAFGVAIDELWQEHMTPALARVRRARSGFNDLVRLVERRALSFGDTDEFRALSERFNRETYLLGALIIEERNEQIERLGRLPDVNTPIRVDKGVDERRAIAAFDLSLVDEEAIEALNRVHVMWFTDPTGAVYLSDTFSVAAREIIEQGTSGIEISTKLVKLIEQTYGIGASAGKGLGYWAGVSEHAATTAGISGQLTTLQRLDWPRYVIVNPMDERTTPVCQAMNGKSLLVSDGLANLNALLESETPNDVRSAKPFVSGGSAAQLEQAAGTRLLPGARTLTPEQSRRLRDSGFAMPPFHFRCRSFIDIDF